MRTGALDDVARHEPSCPVALPTVLRRGLVLPGIGALGAVYSAAAEAATLRDWSTREVHGFMLRELSLVTDCGVWRDMRMHGSVAVAYSGFRL